MNTTRFKRIVWTCLFGVLVSFSVGITGLRVMLWGANIYKPSIEHYISQQLGKSVSIGRFNAAFQTGVPELVLHQFNIYENPQKVKSLLSLRKVHLRLNLFSVFTNSLLSGVQITLTGGAFTVTRLATGAISIQGLPNSEDKTEPTWLMEGANYHLIDSTIIWQDKKRHAQAIKFNHVNVLVHNEGVQHLLSVEAQLPNSLGKSLRLAMKLEGDIFKPKTTKAQLYVHGEDINFADIIDGDLPFKFTLGKGRGDFKFWSEWVAAEMTTLSGSLTLKSTNFSLDNVETHHLKQLSFLFKAQKKSAKQWLLTVQDVFLNIDSINFNLAQFSFSVAQDEKGAFSSFGLDIPQINLKPLNQWLQKTGLLEESEFQGVRVSGQLKTLVLWFDVHQQRFSLQMQASNVSFKNKGATGFKNLSFYLRGTEQAGEVVLDVKNMIIQTPQVFRNTLYLKKGFGLVNWKQKDTAWKLESPWLILENRDIKTNTKFSLNIPKKKEEAGAYLTLQSYFYEGTAAEYIGHYLPLPIMSKGLITWFDNAFIKGKVSTGGLVIRGPLNKFPFVKHQGVFETIFKAHAVDLLYDAKWPVVRNAGAEIRFFADSFQIDIDRGYTDKVKIKRFLVSIDSYEHSQYLKLKGQLQGDLSSGIQFLKASPFKKTITNVSDILALQGEFDLSLAIGIPLKKLPLKLDIKLQSKQAKAIVLPAKLPLSNITANIIINEQGIFSEKITAAMLGFPVEISLRSQLENTEVIVTGHTSISQLATQFPHRLWTHLSGSSDYKIKLNCPADISLNNDISFSSDLTGIAIDLPPFSKLKAFKNPTSLSLGMNSLGVNDVVFLYEPPHSPENRFDINIKKIAAYWQGLIHSPFASGSVFIPVDFSKKSLLNIRLSKLDLSALATLKLKPAGKKAFFSINHLPAIQLESNSLWVNKVNFGTVVLATETDHNTIFIKQLLLKNSKHSLNVSGYWQHNTRYDKTKLEGRFMRKNLGEFLKEMRITDNLVGGNADFKFSLQSDKPIYTLDAKYMTGKVNAKVNKGRILGIDTGLGRILGALDIFKLVERIKLNFSDITESGLSFSMLTADFNLNKGRVKTDNVLMNAMPAKIKMSGQTDLTTQALDIKATVLPKFPIAGTIIGSATNAISKVLSGDEHAGGLLVSLLYHIKGTWQNLIIERKVYSSKHSYNKPLPQP